MNIFINTVTSEFPLYEGDVRLLHPEIPLELTGDSFPVPEEFAKVVATPVPVYDGKVQVLDPVQAEKINGVWTQKWVIRDLTPEEIDAIEKAREADVADTTKNVNIDTTALPDADENLAVANITVLNP